LQKKHIFEYHAVKQLFKNVAQILNKKPMGSDAQLAQIARGMSVEHPKECPGELLGRKCPFSGETPGSPCKITSLYLYSGFDLCHPG